VKRRVKVSDISILSQEYKTSAELAERVNQALMIISLAASGSADARMG